ncbi:hypothetical protein Taro_023402 [Colocasia esculenta]|uniref:Uncharacterized protein n=1 Tax=Colocasia esculenta TaxID=4460 RepID=A0A843V6C3_COLES|nr:hypothetical protein [Colocasia esculenta]
MQAHKLHLPLHHRPRSSPSPSADPSSSSSSLAISSLLVEPFSRSLALMLSDSSVLLYPPFPVLPPAPRFPSPTPVPPVSTSVCFLRLQPSPNSNLGRVLFLSAAPHGASVLLRAWILSPDGGNGGQRFCPARLSHRQDRSKLGIVLDLRHGFSVTLAASVNVFVVHSSAAGRIWVYAARMLGQVGEEETAVEIIKCAAIECTSPIFSLQVSLGFLLLGEVGGVRVFPLKQLIKGRAARRNDSRGEGPQERKLDSSIEPFSSRGRKLPNGALAGVVTGKNGTFHASVAHSESTGSLCNGKGGASIEGKVHVTSDAPPVEKNGAERIRDKLRTIKLRQNSGDFSSYFVAIDSPTKISLSSLPAKAISIHALSHKRFLILDSTGDMHLLSLCSPILASETAINTSDSSKDACTMRLDYSMKVRMLAVLPDLSMRTQIIWISDAFHSVHIVSLADAIENDKSNSKKKLAQVSAIQAIFTRERIQDILPLTANAVMILGQDVNIWSMIEF